jgi:2-methylisocitrate lyase-like PEP mutase family enzyme
LDKNKQKQLAQFFSEMHKNNNFFILPNIWDAGSAKVFEKKGFKAVATTSAGIAYSLGLSDGENVCLDELCYLIEQITKRISIPLSVDIERGYGNSAVEVKESVKKVIQAGAVGINIEDGYTEAPQKLEDINIQLEKIKAINELKQELDTPFVINARTCVYWLKLFTPAKRLEVAISRGNAFRKAGADCIFIPGAIEKNVILELTNNIHAPLNIIANPVFNDIDSIEHIGVTRLSIGSGAVRATYNKLIEIAEDLKDNKSIEQMLNHRFSYAKANEFFA